MTNKNAELLELWNKVGNIPASEVWVESSGDPSSTPGEFVINKLGGVETQLIALVIRHADNPTLTTKQPIHLEITKVADPTQRMIDYFRWYAANVSEGGD